MELDLSPVEARVLGSLLEKERTVPATYPLTMSALVTACNQSSSRAPVMTLSEAEVEAAVESLKARKLVRRVLASHGARATKHRQVADETLGLDGPSGAVMALLLLRGPQTPQELLTRAERLHRFRTPDEVEATLRALAEREPPLVRLLPRQPGQRGARWAHLLSGEPDVAADGAAPAPPPAPPTAPRPPAVQAALHGELRALVGTWIGSGEGRYPTIESFGYTEEIVIEPVPDKALLTYRSRTRAVDDGRGLHAESGFLRLLGDGAVELVVAAGPGVVEVASGLVDDGATALEVVLASDAVVTTPTAKSVTATERTYRVAADTLTYDIAMAAVGEPLTHHLSARLQRLDPT